MSTYEVIMVIFGAMSLMIAFSGLMIKMLTHFEDDNTKKK